MNSSRWLRQLAAATLVLTCIGALRVTAQMRSSSSARVPVVMLSDLHFDPYQDPAKFSQLRTAPVSEWTRILNSPASAHQGEDFQSLQKSCDARGADSSWTVLNGSLQAAHKQVPKPLFVTVSGDLLTHHFDCRLHTLMPNATANDINDFAKKTVTFVAQQLHSTFPNTPVYLALGNNDSGCADYAETRNSDYLKNAGRSFAADMIDESSRNTILTEFSDQGDYNIALPKPMQHARLIVLQDIFASTSYKSCDGKPDNGKAAAAQIAWLQTQLAKARAHHENVWVMAHIPPGIDVYNSFHKYVLNPSQICSVTAPKTFLTSEALSDTITQYADVVHLALFAHTHMDEMKLLHNSAGKIVAAKLVPSVSPINGNSPAFTVAQVDPNTATLMDYSIFIAHGQDVSSWHEAYSYASTYNMPDYSANSVQQLTSKLSADKSGNADLSQRYQRWFYPGDVGIFGLGLHQIWPAYACAMTEDGGPAFHNCMCPAD